MPLIEDMTALAWTALRKPLESFMLTSAVIGNGVLLGRDGSLVSLFHLDGSRALMGPGEMAAFVELACRRLNSDFTAPGHALHVVFERAPDEAAALVEAVSRHQHSRARECGLRLDDVISERSRRLVPLLAAETLVIACWTRPAVLLARQEERDRNRLRKRLRHWIPSHADAQCPLAVHDSLLPRHEALVETLAGVLAEGGLIADRLDDDEALRTIRRFLNGPDAAGSDWRPVTNRNEAPPRMTDPPEIGGFPPPLAPQLLVRDPVRRGSMLEIGNRAYGALDMVLGPRSIRPFSELIGRAAAADIPFRFSLLIEGGALTGMHAALTRVGAAFLAFSSDDSLLVRNAMRDLDQFAARSRAVVRCRLGLLTWVSVGSPESRLARRVSRLQQIAEGWSEMILSPITGDPLETFAVTVPGFCCAGTAEPGALPLEDGLAMVPVARPAPVGREMASHIFRSPDGKMLPFSWRDGEDYGFDVIHGLPGRGKSVLMNSLSLAFCMDGRHDRLPLAATIDIGLSSRGLISLLRAALPPDRRDEAGWFGLQMTAGHAINPCDTQLGCREPLPGERAFLETLLGLILTPAGAGGVPDGLRELIPPVLAEAYRLRSDRVPGGEPHGYRPGRDAAVDRAIEQAGCHLPVEPLWWEVVDSLFAAGFPDAAARAQRYAVPVLGDLITAVRAPSVQDLIGNAVLGHSGEGVTSAFIRIMTALAGSWPVMFAPTQFDIGSARVAAIDLKEVAPGGSPEADRQTSAFYMLARHALTRHWWIPDDAIDAVEPAYRSWHAARLAEIRDTPKRLAYDEFHRTGGVTAVRAQLERDVREARKQRVRITLASQRLDDFGEALIELANRYWVLGSGGKASELESLSRLFTLNETARAVVQNTLNGPGRDGAPALLIAIGPRGRFEQIVINTPGPVELWALTTRPRDAALRDRVYERLRPAEARAVLAQRFPSGSASEWIEAEFSRLENQGDAPSEAGLLDRIANELCEHAGAYS